MENKEYPMIVREGRFYRVKTNVRNYLSSVFTNYRSAQKAMEIYKVKCKEASERLLKAKAEKQAKKKEESKED